MTATAEVKPWDFSHVLDLVNSLSFLEPPPTSAISRNEERAGKNEATLNDHDSNTHDTEQDKIGEEQEGLGDFSKLWQFLGTPAESSYTAQPNPTIAGPTPQKQSTLNTSELDEIKQTPQLQDVSSGEDRNGGTVSDSSLTPETPTLTKSQRKKKNRKERRALEVAAAQEEEAAKILTSLSEPEPTNVSSKTPAKPQTLRITDTAPNTPKNKYNLRPRDASGNAVCASDRENAISVAVAKLDAAKKANTKSLATQQHGAQSAPTAHANSTLTRRQSNPAHFQPSKSTLSSNDTLRVQSNAQKLLSAPDVDPKLQLLPSTVTPHTRSTLPNSVQPQSLPKQTSAKKNYATAIGPMVARSGEDRHWALLLKLIGDFHEDRKHLISPMNLTTHNNDRKGIHVFGDASNIFIGFNDQLKRSRGIPWHVQVPSADLSFDALALLMERRRPVAKRVLVGSTPHLPAFDKAKAVGYECNILEKVYKARELTERQIYFKELDQQAYRNRGKRAKAPPANNVATLSGGYGSGDGSGSETNTPQYAPARMIEQGVDEILHLKILESIVDTDVPSTIVLATGDAARAEYSEGFMAMAQRALKKGWTVELVSWSKNISAMYTRREWAQAWGERFRIVTLDDYAEELLDM